MTRRTLLILWLASLAVGCRSSREFETTAAPPALVVPIEMTVAQRSTTAVPGARVPVTLTIDDVTQGQVMVTLATRDRVLVPQRSLTEGAAASFTIGGAEYTLRLRLLHNSPLGQDEATFRIDESAGGAPSEEAKIEQLIESIAALENAVFVRNGAGHSAADAVAHLRRKWRAAGDRIRTAEQFIDGIAAQSSTSGEAYTIRFADGRVATSREFLLDRLREIEADE